MNSSLDWRSRHPDEVLPARLKNGQEIGHSKQFSHPLVEADQSQVAVGPTGRDVQSHDGAESRAVDVLEIRQVQDNQLGGRDQVLDLLLEVRRQACGQLAAASHDRCPFLDVDLQLQAAGWN